MRRVLGVCVGVLAAVPLASCSGEESGTATESTGGTGTPAAGTGGASAATTGGASATGGASVATTGGASATGGAPVATTGGASATGGATNEPAPATDTIFTSPDMPECVYDTETQHQIRGVLNGEAIDVRATAMASELFGAKFRTFVFESNFVYPLELTWNVQPREDYPIPLDGGTLRMRDGQPFAGESFCITAGELGTRSVQAQADARELLFHISGARAGDCSGEEVPVELFGCILRSGSYFPTSLTVNFPVDSSRPDLDSAKDLAALTDEERATLCDWSALMLGGYGQTTDCRPIGGTSVMTYRDQEQCLALVFSRVCPGVTVEEHVNCLVATAPTRGCTYPSDACAPVEGVCN
jgi:hypothetical protein